MADADKRPIDHALDALVYVPVGFAVSAREVLPKLATRGREHLTGQVTAARMVGRFAVQQGQSQAGKAFGKARVEAQRRLEDMSRGSGTADDVPPAASATAAPAPAKGKTAKRTATSGPGADGLAIPGYDSLSASQVLPRLEGLSTDELEAVRAYEASHRGRKTILGRVAQLQNA